MTEPEATQSEITEIPKETTETEAEEITYSIDYTEQLTRIEEALNNIDEQIEVYGSVSFLDTNGIGFVNGKVNINDIFSVLLLICIMLGLIFGSLVFRHFRK